MQCGNAGRHLQIGAVPIECKCTFAATQLARPLLHSNTPDVSPYSREPKSASSAAQVPLAVEPRVQVRQQFPEIRLAPSVGLQQSLSRARPGPQRWIPPGCYIRRPNRSFLYRPSLHVPTADQTLSRRLTGTCWVNPPLALEESRRAVA